MRALVIFKQSLLERIGNRPVVRTLDQRIRSKLIRSDQENRNAIHDVFYTLIQSHLDVDLVSRTDFKKIISKNRYDVVIAVGGDGTLFHAAHYVRDIPCILVNSEPEHSVGIFASCTKETFGKEIDSFINGAYRISRLNRGAICVGDREIPELFTNDVLVSDQNPASIYRFDIVVDGKKKEYIESSGIWISTAAGSTAATFAAGGSMMKMNDNRLQYVVRETYYYRTKIRSIKGFAKTIEINPHSPNGFIYLDGPRCRHKVDMGSRVCFSISNHPLMLINYSENQRRRIISKIRR